MGIDPSVFEAILVKNGHISSIGDLLAIEKQAETGVLVVDLNGKTLMPAFNDAHIHIWKVGDLLTFWTCAVLKVWPKCKGVSLILRKKILKIRGF